MAADDERRVGLVAGVVRDDHGEPIPDAEVIVYQAGCAGRAELYADPAMAVRVDSILTGSDGAYLFYARAGLYDMRILSRGRPEMRVSDVPCEPPQPTTEPFFEVVAVNSGGRRVVEWRWEIHVEWRLGIGGRLVSRSVYDAAVDDASERVVVVIPAGDIDDHIRMAGAQSFTARPVGTCVEGGSIAGQWTVHIFAPGRRCRVALAVPRAHALGN